MALTRDELAEVVEELGTHKGRHTELITVYVPAGYDINSVQRQLEAEKSTAKNIKSTATRKNVIDALEKIIRYLKGLKKTPENGLALFCGNISKHEGDQDLQLWDIEPPMPLKARIYRCDKEFVLDALQEMLEVEEVFGLLVMDRKEATIGLLEGKRIEKLQHLTSGIPSKVRAGGQCLSPDSWVSLNKENKNIIDLNINDKIRALDVKNNKIIFTKVKNKWETVKSEVLKIIVEDGEFIMCSTDHTFFKKIKNIIEEVVARDLNKDDILICSNNHDILELKIVDIKGKKGDFNLVDIETEAGNFFANGILVHNSSKRFHRITEGMTKEFYKRVAEQMKKIFFNNKKLKGILVGGPIPTKDEFLDGDYLVTQLREKVLGRIDQGDTGESGLGELVERSQDILANQEIIREKKILERFFEILGTSPDKAFYDKDNIKKALEYGAVETLLLSKNIDKKIAKELIKTANDTGANIEIISDETEEGQQFNNLSGVGAILRFKI